MPQALRRYREKPDGALSKLSVDVMSNRPTGRKGTATATSVPLLFLVSDVDFSGKK